MSHTAGHFTECSKSFSLDELLLKLFPGLDLLGESFVVLGELLYELLLFVPVEFQLSCHLVEGFSQTFYFVSSLERNFLMEISLGNGNGTG